MNSQQKAIDPICGMTVDTQTALTASKNGDAFYFCSDHCLIKFNAQSTAELEKTDCCHRKSEGEQHQIGSHQAPALAQANVGIAMGTGTDIAIESGGVTLVKGDLSGIVNAIQLSRDTMRNIRQNLFFAFI